MPKDRLYAASKDGSTPFRFDAAVAEVFPDMLRRSIPGYTATLDAIGSLAARYVTAGTHCYDLGCSLAAATLAMRQGIRAPDCRIFAIDNAPAMIERAREIVARETASTPRATAVEVLLDDIRSAPLSNASMVVMNYTLQFIDTAGRDEMLQRIGDALLPGGLLLLSEKVVDEDEHLDALLIELHHEHKRRNAYSELEISRKRAALDRVLVPETVTAHRDRLRRAGFRHVGVWLRFFNFVSILAVK